MQSFQPQKLARSAPGHGRNDPLVDAVAPYEALAGYATVRQRRSAYMHAEAEETELATIHRSGATGLPYSELGWVDRLVRQLKLDVTIRPRGRPRKDLSHAEK